MGMTRPLAYAMFFSMFVFVVSSGSTAVAYDIGIISDCTTVTERLAGCGGFVKAIIASAAIGTIAGAPDIVNWFFGTIGILIRVSVLGKVVRLFPGVRGW